MSLKEKLQLLKEKVAGKKTVGKTTGIDLGDYFGNPFGLTFEEQENVIELLYYICDGQDKGSRDILLNKYHLEIIALATSGKAFLANVETDVRGTIYFTTKLQSPYLEDDCKKM